MDIRKADIRDAAEIGRVYTSSWKTAYKGLIPQAYLDGLSEEHWVPSFENWLADRTVTAVVLTEGQKIVGCSAYVEARDEGLPGWGEIISIYLLPDYFGKGYGKKLFRHTLGLMEQEGYRCIYLWVLKGNFRAIRFYEKNGFAFNGDTMQISIMDEPLTDLKYVYEIK
jgi:ribosomal protein S18 acetylase RimI-like enzyme